jgi:hypothetical protein
MELLVVSARNYRRLGDHCRHLGVQAVVVTEHTGDGPACIECWCDGDIVNATTFVVFRWLCDKYVARLI